MCRISSVTPGEILQGTTIIACLNHKKRRSDFASILTDCFNVHCSETKTPHICVSEPDNQYERYRHSSGQSNQTASSVPSTSASLERRDDIADFQNPVHKYKHSILQRYLNDSILHSSSSPVPNMSLLPEGQDGLQYRRLKVNSFSGSVSSHDFEDIKSPERREETQTTDRASPSPSQGTLKALSH